MGLGPGFLGLLAPYFSIGSKLMLMFLALSVLMALVGLANL
jgi:hypothetical protein